MHKPDRGAQPKTHRLVGIVFALLPILLVGFAIRLAIVLQTWAELPDGLSISAGILWGVLADTIYAGYAVIPMAIYLAIVPQNTFQNRIHRAAMWLFFALVWWSVLVCNTADWLFWQEFGVRPNFIAVDYLIYTNEVIDNIVESYPVGIILFGTAVFALLSTYIMTSKFPLYRNWLLCRTPAKSRYSVMILLLAFPLLATAYVSQRSMPDFHNNYLQEIAKNGQYSFFAAFRNNELDYSKFYQRMATDEATQRLTDLIAEPRSEITPGTGNILKRPIVARGEERYPNVIQITVESLSADFLGTFGNKDELTPNLDSLADESLLFTNFMSTGTRTVRGMESLTLSVPPTPGRSIVKRPENKDLFNIGSVFWIKGYDVSFFYGGRGYFDNMNAFFGNNGFSIHDQTSESPEDVEFTNAWGVSDEDLYRWVLEDADRSASQNKPFYYFVMTTSNHRPYTYPDGRIDIPSGTSRSGAVKYTDYAIGKLVAEASTKPWFDNTVFVIVADHCANSAGKTDLPVKNYHIPLLMYAPAIFEARRIDTLSSQIDYAPTLFSLLNWSYWSEFYGKNIIDMKPDDGRALLGTYQNLGLLEEDTLTVLKPLRIAETYRVDFRSGEQLQSDIDDSERLDTIAFYQTAADNYDAYREGHRVESRHN
jgi:phosphoglycerol transferase MdoB-like AlkP superfamily enzyme